MSGRDAARGDHLLRPGGLELTARAVAFAVLGRGETLLDLGCGSGESVRYFRTLGIDAIGIDFEPNVVVGSGPCVSSKSNIVADAADLPFPDGSFEGVLAECSLSLMEDQDAVLAECARVLADYGRLMITDLYARQPDAVAQVRALKGSCVSDMMVRSELEARLVLHGFTVNLWEDHSHDLREATARFIFEHGSLEELWACDSEPASTEEVANVMRAARVGYFLMIATRNRRSAEQRGTSHER
jgi:SAM-dependent methyltransferase